MSSESNTERPERYRLKLAELGSVVAVAVSFLALGLGVYQTRIMLAQARASVWPSLAISANYADHAGFTWNVDNHGIGPAKLMSIGMRVDDVVVRAWSDVFQRVLKKPIEGVSDADYVGIRSGVVLPPDSNRETTLSILHLRNADDAATFFAAIRSHRFKLQICYC